jgi:hypothetical protein
MKKHSILSVVLIIGLCFVVLLLVQAVSTSYRLPGNNQGYEPIQPIAYSHRLHAGELGLDCFHCHGGAEISQTAGIPSASICMNCHRFITAPFNEIREEDERAQKEKRPPSRIVSAELQKLYASFGLREDFTPDPGIAPDPIEWIKIHSVPDYVAFDHRAHVSARVDCQTCHGEVQTMERVRQVSDLSMGWCVNCHRETNRDGVKGVKVNAPIDCIACHH